jgi:hypothetical protein
MELQELNNLLEKRIQKMRTVLASKGSVYTAGDLDRLHNFKLAGRIGGTSPEMALKGMLIKHIASVFDMIDMCENCDEDGDPGFDSARVDEKVGDTILYMVLLEALFTEGLETARRVKSDK